MVTMSKDVMAVLKALLNGWEGGHYDSSTSSLAEDFLDANDSLRERLDMLVGDDCGFDDLPEDLREQAESAQSQYEKLRHCIVTLEYELPELVESIQTLVNAAEEAADYEDDEDSAEDD